MSAPRPAKSNRICADVVHRIDPLCCANHDQPNPNRTVLARTDCGAKCHSAKPTKARADPTTRDLEKRADTRRATGSLHPGIDCRHQKRGNYDDPRRLTEGAWESDAVAERQYGNSEPSWPAESRLCWAKHGMDSAPPEHPGGEQQTPAEPVDRKRQEIAEPASKHS